MVHFVLEYGVNHISNFDTCTLDWSEKITSKERYDLVIGCEIFYDEVILADISHVLEQVLAPGGQGIFCDPNRLGLDTIELGFKEIYLSPMKPLEIFL